MKSKKAWRFRDSVKFLIVIENDFVLPYDVRLGFAIAQIGHNFKFYVNVRKVKLYDARRAVEVATHYTGKGARNHDHSDFSCTHEVSHCSLNEANIQIKVDKLFTLNKYAVFAHVGSFVLVLVFYLAWKNSHPHAIAQTYRYALPEADQLGVDKCNSDPSSSQGAGQCTTSYAYAPPHKIFKFNIIFGVLAFFAITAIAHAYYATDGFHTGNYTSVVRAGWNPYRWIEYGISASLMSILIAYALGVRDGIQLISLALVTAGMQSSGFVVEAALIRKPINTAVIKGATAAGWLAFLALWLPILYNFISLYLDVEGKYKNEIDPQTGRRVKIPGFVWFIIIVQLLHYAGFGIVQWRQLSAALSGTPSVFSAVERKYVMLSFSAKLSLALGLGYGLLFRTHNCPA